MRVVSNFKENLLILICCIFLIYSIYQDIPYEDQLFRRGHILNTLKFTRYKEALFLKETFHEKILKTFTLL